MSHTSQDGKAVGHPAVDERETSHVHGVQEKWLPVWDELAPFRSGAPGDARPRTDGDCTRQVVRGGSWASSQAAIRSAARASQPRSYRASDLGLRLARSPKE